MKKYVKYYRIMIIVKSSNKLDPCARMNTCFCCHRASRIEVSLNAKNTLRGDVNKANHIVSMSTIQSI